MHIKTSMQKIGAINMIQGKSKLLIACMALACLQSLNVAAEGNKYLGTNLGAAAIGGSVLPGKQGTNYIWASETDVNKYADLGFNTLRIPFLWERMQPELNNPLSETEASYLDLVIKTASKKNVTIIIDVHNYGAYRGNLIGTESVPINAFNDFWSRIATRYKDSPNVMFGLMNEPNKQKADEWAKIAQSAIYAIRKTGAKQVILIPGTRWSSAYGWMSKDGKLSNGEALDGIDDPSNNFIFEMHQYFDSNTAGTSSSCVSKDIGIERLSAVTEWLRAKNRKALLGEFGSSTDAVCLAALDNTLNFMKSNADIWAGWTYWVAAPWMGNYMFNIYPPDANRPQLKILQKYLKK